MRFRHVYLGIGSVLVLLLWILTDPKIGLIQSLPIGASTVATIVLLLKTVLYAGVLHFTRKGLIDYVDLKKYFDRALQTPEGAGHATIAIGLIFIAIAITIHAATN